MTEHDTAEGRAGNSAARPPLTEAEYAAWASRRVHDYAGDLNQRLAGVLPDGVRFEFTTTGGPPMTAKPQRRAERQHLDARVVPVERALLARADALERMAGGVAPETDPPEAAVMLRIAAEFRALADELHWW